MQKFKTRGLIPLLVVGVIITIPRLFPQTRHLIDTAKAMTQATWQAMDTAKTLTHEAAIPDSEYYQLVPGSIYDGDTLRVTDGLEELKLRLCGIDAPEKEQPLGLEARDHLRSLIDQGDGTVIVVPIEEDRYGRTVAELFIPTTTGEEIHINSQMVLDGYAYHYERYSDSCPNQGAIALGEEQAGAENLGVWAGDHQRPWEYRQQK